MATQSMEQILNTAPTSTARDDARSYATGRVYRALGITAFIAATLIGCDAYRARDPAKAVVAGTCANEAILLAGLGYGMRKHE